MKFSISNHQFATATVPASGTVKIYLYNNGEQAHEVLFYDADLAQWRICSSHHAVLTAPDNCPYPQPLPARLRELGVAYQAENIAAQLCEQTRAFAQNRRDAFCRLKR